MAVATVWGTWEPPGSAWHRPPAPARDGERGLRHGKPWDGQREEGAAPARHGGMGNKPVSAPGGWLCFGLHSVTPTRRGGGGAAPGSPRAAGPDVAAELAGVGEEEERGRVRGWQGAARAAGGAAPDPREMEAPGLEAGVHLPGNAPGIRLGEAVEPFQVLWVQDEAGPVTACSLRRALLQLSGPELRGTAPAPSPRLPGHCSWAASLHPNTARLLRCIPASLHCRAAALHPCIARLLCCILALPGCATASLHCWAAPLHPSTTGVLCCIPALPGCSVASLHLSIAGLRHCIPALPGCSAASQHHQAAPLHPSTAGLAGLDSVCWRWPGGSCPSALCWDRDGGG